MLREPSLIVALLVETDDVRHPKPLENINVIVGRQSRVAISIAM
jgi:hypothetical protein